MRRNYKTKFPVARIKKIMQLDEDVGKVAQATPVLISKALELFMQSLIDEACVETRAKNAKRLTVAHLKKTIQDKDQFDFLRDIVANVADPAESRAAEKASADKGGSEGPSSAVAAVPPPPPPSTRRGRGSKATPSAPGASGRRRRTAAATKTAATSSSNTNGDVKMAEDEEEDEEEEEEEAKAEEEAEEEEEVMETPQASFAMMESMAGRSLGRKG
ncbi:hypothetical protein DFQ26_008794 [Actinomortierella ambigua]|nr:hypothetical protein DFQ26_008794 [Actinomortierella ambigua]